MGSCPVSIKEEEAKTKSLLSASSLYSYPSPSFRDNLPLPCFPCSNMRKGEIEVAKVSAIQPWFKPLKRKLLSLRLKRCGLIVGDFRRVTPTFFQFLDNRSRIMLAAGANPIFAHTSLLGCLEVESEASNERFFPRPSAIESAAVAGQDLQTLHRQFLDSSTCKRIAILSHLLNYDIKATPTTGDSRYISSNIRVRDEKDRPFVRGWWRIEEQAEFRLSLTDYGPTIKIDHHFLSDQKMEFLCPSLPCLSVKPLKLEERFSTFNRCTRKRIGGPHLAGLSRFQTCPQHHFYSGPISPYIKQKGILPSSKVLLTTATTAAFFTSTSMIGLSRQVQEALASGRITIARPGGILYRMLIHQVYPLSLTSVAFPEGAASVKTLPTINREGAETDLNEGRKKGSHPSATTLAGNESRNGSVSLFHCLYARLHKERKPLSFIGGLYLSLGEVASKVSSCSSRIGFCPAYVRAKLIGAWDFLKRVQGSDVKVASLYNTRPKQCPKMPMPFLVGPRRFPTSLSSFLEEEAELVFSQSIHMENKSPRIFLFDEASLNSSSDTSCRTPSQSQSTTTITDYSQQSSSSSHGIFEDHPGLNPTSERVVELQAEIGDRFVETVKSAGDEALFPEREDYVAAVEQLHGESNNIEFLQSLADDLGQNGAGGQTYQEGIQMWLNFLNSNSPLEQFSILPLIPMKIGNLYFSFTNPSLFMLLTLSLVLLFVHFVTKKGGGNSVPNAWQSLVELIYDFVPNLCYEWIISTGYCGSPPGHFTFAAMQLVEINLAEGFGKPSGAEAASSLRTAYGGVKIERKGDDEADRLVRMYLSFFSLYKVITLAKSVNDGLFSSIVEAHPKDVARSIREYAASLGVTFPELLRPYVPDISSSPLHVGIVWEPTWKALPSHGARWMKAYRLLWGRSSRKKPWKSASVLWSPEVFVPFSPDCDDKVMDQLKIGSTLSKNLLDLIMGPSTLPYCPSIMTMVDWVRWLKGADLRLNSYWEALPYDCYR
ncbi:hypothetical protein BUALT_BualtUnG0045200 [Buddleja alternifolia]|uniref:F-ATPase protein 6 n=1 Tax=Buddleja alternifolia TaxID=168488 RepID=A0AAV6W6A6_9LAMI|nr:hypothetical protein BUALT_BualtUnG0045200 [Buddleja alternifolia]